MHDSTAPRRYLIGAIFMGAGLAHSSSHNATRRLCRLIVMQLAAAQLANGLSVVVDAVFMGPDRAQMQQLALRHGALWRPIHIFVSDEFHGGPEPRSDRASVATTRRCWRSALRCLRPTCVARRASASAS